MYVFRIQTDLSNRCFWQQFKFHSQFSKNLHYVEHLHFVGQGRNVALIFGSVDFTRTFSYMSTSIHPFFVHNGVYAGLR